MRDFRMKLATYVIRLAILRLMPRDHHDTIPWLIAAGTAGRLSMTRACKGRMDEIEEEFA